MAVYPVRRWLLSDSVVTIYSPYGENEIFPLKRFVLHAQVNIIQIPNWGFSPRIAFSRSINVLRMRCGPFPCSSSHIVSRNIQGNAVVGQDRRNIISPPRTRTRRIAHKLKMKRRRATSHRINLSTASFALSPLESPPVALCGELQERMKTRTIRAYGKSGAGTGGLRKAC